VTPCSLAGRYWLLEERATSIFGFEVCIGSEELVGLYGQAASDVVTDPQERGAGGEEMEPGRGQ
jgi:hypothetical protein